MNQTEKEEILRKLYYDPATGLSSPMALYNRVKSQKITLKEVHEFIKKQETNQIFQPTKKTKITYAPIIGLQNGEFQTDLMFLTQYKTKNQGYHVILNFIEITSRKAYSYKLKNKKGNEIIECFKQFIKEAGNVKKLTADRGSEYINKQWKDIATQHNIEMHYTPTGDKTMTGKVERFNRTLRDKITKYMKTYKTLQWYDKLDDFISNYNSSKHSSTGFAPNDVTKQVSDVIRQRDQHRIDMALEYVQKFKVDDRVRIRKFKTMFAKGSDTWSSGIYTVVSVQQFSLTLKGPKGQTVSHVKPYNVKLVNVVETAPPVEGVEKHSVKKNKQMNTFKNKQVREGFDNVQDTGEVVINKRLEPKQETRQKTTSIQAGDRIKSLWKDTDGKMKYFNGTIKKVNTQTYRVLFDDGVVAMMKKHEVVKL